ncbi:G-protein coupled receptor 1 [Durusdinium trenchii]|uniref:G-protein coupled receptor 1 n=1 Tax=Durusdinium trenchii TaxID=1381693 RepID=A0ABP0IKD6_9DINO
MVALTPGDESDDIGYGPLFKTLNTVSSVLSILGCLLVIGAFLGFPALRRYFARLVLYLAISDLWLCTSFLMGEFERPHYTKCVVQSMLGIFFGLSSVLWTVAIADSIRRIVMARDLTVESRHEKRLHIVSWGLPLLALGTVLLLGASGPSGMICWIENSALGTVLRLSTFYLPLWLAIAYSLWVYWCVSQRLSHLLDEVASSNADEYEGTAFEYHKDLERQRRSLRLLMLLPLILVFCWSPSSLRRLLDVIFPHMGRSVLDYVCVFTGPLQGFLNALVYGSTPAVRDAITGRFDHGAAKLKGLKSQLRMLRRKKRNFQNLEEDHF